MKTVYIVFDGYDGKVECVCSSESGAQMQVNQLMIALQEGGSFADWKKENPTDWEYFIVPKELIE